MMKVTNVSREPTFKNVQVTKFKATAIGDAHQPISISKCSKVDISFGCILKLK